MHISTKKLTLSHISKLKEEEHILKTKRLIREPLLSAFDIYKSNVYYGVIEESEEEKAVVLTWYKDLCDLKESAISNVPQKILKYVKKENEQ
jgi:hypothetical protein